MDMKFKITDGEFEVEYIIKCISMYDDENCNIVVNWIKREAFCSFDVFKKNSKNYQDPEKYINFLEKVKKVPIKHRLALSFNMDKGSKSQLPEYGLIIECVEG